MNNEVDIINNRQTRLLKGAKADALDSRQNKILKMKKLYVSRYCYFFHSTAGAFLAYSSKTNSFIELSEPLFELLKKHQSDGSPVDADTVQDDILDALCKEGFVGQEDSDDNFVLESQFVTQAVQHDTTKLNLILVPTLNCNFNCPYCFENGKRGGVMSKDTINDLLEFIKENKNRWLYKPEKHKKQRALL